MPRPRFERLEPDRRAEVLDTAAAEFGAHGYFEASLNRIQGALGLSKGAFYYWFDDKEDLFVTTLEDRLATITATAPGLLSGTIPEGPFWPMVEATVVDGMALMAEHADKLPLLKAALAAPQSARLAALWARGRQVVTDVLRVGITQGVVRQDMPVDLLASLAYSMGEAMDRWTLGQLEAGALTEEADLAELLASYTDLMHRLLDPA